MRFNVGWGVGGVNREKRREEIKARAHLSMSIRVEKKSNVSQVEKLQLALIKDFPSQAHNGAAR